MLSIMARPFPRKVIGDLENECFDKDAVTLSFSADPQLLAFSHYFANNDSEFFTSVLYECLTMDKPESIGAYMTLYDTMLNLNHVSDSRSIWNFKLILTYYEYFAKEISSPKKRLLHHSFTQTMRYRLDDHFALDDFYSRPKSDPFIRLFKIYHNFPLIHVLEKLKACLKTLGNIDQERLIYAMMDEIRGNNESSIRICVDYLLREINT